MSGFILTHSDKIGQFEQCHLVYKESPGGEYVGSIQPKEGGYLASYRYPVAITQRTVTAEEAFEFLKEMANGKR